MAHPLQHSHVAAFRDSLVAKNPAIGNYLSQMDAAPFFLIAATGLGKTVVAPVHLLERAMRTRSAKAPRVWVIEPKIFIVQDQERMLNRLWNEFCASRGIQSRPLFGCKTKVDHRNMDAQIIFVTTGIFSILAKNGTFRPGLDGVLIDEAHDTLETDHAMELAVAVCRQQGIRVDLMSATVDETCLEKAFPDLSVIRALPKRYPIWMHNTGRVLEECIVDIVEQTLIRFDPDGPYAPPSDHPNGKGVAAALAENGRAKGLLVIVTSYADDKSDAQRIFRVLKSAPFAREIEIGLLSGETRRDPEQLARYEASIKRWQQDKRRYVLIATSVVEMGVTLPDLDVVVSTDQGLIDDDVTGGMKRGTLGINALMQRCGRVGRQRPGLFVITKDSGSSYADKSDDDLNSGRTLEPEPIDFPMRKGPLTCLAYHACVEGWQQPEFRRRLADLRLPSRIDEDDDRYQDFLREHAKLHRIGAEQDGRLTADGRRLDRWIGRYDPEHALEIMRAYEAGNPFHGEEYFEGWESARRDRFDYAVAECVLEQFGGILSFPKNVLEEQGAPPLRHREYLGNATTEVNRPEDPDAAREVVRAVLNHYGRKNTGPLASWHTRNHTGLRLRSRDAETLNVLESAAFRVLESIEEIMEMLLETGRAERMRSTLDDIVLPYRNGSRREMRR